MMNVPSVKHVGLAALLHSLILQALASSQKWSGTLLQGLHSARICIKGLRNWRTLLKHSMQTWHSSLMDSMPEQSVQRCFAEWKAVSILDARPTSQDLSLVRCRATELAGEQL